MLILDFRLQILDLRNDAGEGGDGDLAFPLSLFAGVCCLDTTSAIRTAEDTGEVGHSDALPQKNLPLRDTTGLFRLCGPHPPAPFSRRHRRRGRNGRRDTVRCRNQWCHESPVSQDADGFCTVTSMHADTVAFFTALREPTTDRCSRNRFSVPGAQR